MIRICEAFPPLNNWVLIYLCLLQYIKSYFVSAPYISFCLCPLSNGKLSRFPPLFHPVYDMLHFILFILLWPVKCYLKAYIISSLITISKLSLKWWIFQLLKKSFSSNWPSWGQNKIIIHHFNKRIKLPS